MRQREAAALKSADPIVIRDKRAPTARPAPVARAKTIEATRTPSALKPAKQASMDYQMGFTSGPSN